MLLCETKPFDNSSSSEYLVLNKYKGNVGLKEDNTYGFILVDVVEGR